MVKLELKHLAPYLPYGLEIWFKTSKRVKIHTMSANNINDVLHYTTNYKPILRPLSDLTKEIEHNGEKFVPIERIDKNNNLEILKCLHDQDFDFPNDTDLFPYWVVCSFIEYHFDVFGLIDKGLAIDINTLKEITNG